MRVNGLEGRRAGSRGGRRHEDCGDGTSLILSPNGRKH